MNWQYFPSSPPRSTGRKAPRPPRYRPRVDRLEDRTLLTLTTFNLDPSSTLSLQGSTFNYNGVPIPISEQGPGSLTTNYTGTLATDLDLNANTIQFFDSGTALTAGISGNWRPGIGGTPGTTDPANYGGTFSVLFSPVYAAIRDLVGSLPTSSPQALTNQGGGTYTFPSNQNLQINQGNLDYETPPSLYGNGRTSITGLAGQNQAADGTLQDNGDGTFTLTAPVSATILYDLGGGASVTIQVNGTITGTGTPGTGPSINGFGGFAQLSNGHSGGSSGLSGAAAVSQGSALQTLPDAALLSESSAGPSAVGSDLSAARVVHAAGTGAVDPLATVDGVFADIGSTGSVLA